MRSVIGVSIVLVLLFSGCGDSTGPEDVELTPSVLSLVFSGDSSSKELGNGDCQITASWTECQEASFLNYSLYRSETEGIAANLSDAEIVGVFTESGTLEFADDNVNWGTEYYYALLTAGTGVDSVWSNEESLETPDSSPTASVLSWTSDADEIFLTWTSCNDSDFASYKLFRSTSPGIADDTTFAEVLFSSQLATDTMFTDQQVDPGTFYYYAVLTANSQDLSSWSNEVEAETMEELPVVQNLEISTESGGRTVILVWEPIQLEIEGYLVFFKSQEGDDWTLVGTAIDEYFSHEAVSAGYYSVKAYKGEATSSDYSAPVNTMPSIVETTYTIYDNYSPAAYHDGFIFGPTAGQTGLAGNSSFSQDIYAYDDGKGDYDVSLYSGNSGPYGNGYQSYFQTPELGCYSNCDPEGTWYGTSYSLYSSDEVVFIKLPYSSGGDAYVKMHAITIVPDPTTNSGTSVSFRYEYQSNEYGFTLFTDSCW